MIGLVFDQNIVFRHWLCSKLDVPYLGYDMQTIAVVKGDSIRAVVGYYNFTENNCFLSIVGEGRWLVKGLIPVFFRYPFVQLNKRRITTLTNEANSRALEFNRRLGFVEEGRMRKAVDDIDVILFGMLKEECRYL